MVNNLIMFSKPEYSAGERCSYPPLLSVEEAWGCNVYVAELGRVGGNGASRPFHTDRKDAEE